MKPWLKDNWFKLAAALLLFWALGGHPYSYYQFLRWAVLIAGAYSSYDAYENKKVAWAWIFGIMAVLFNPIIPFYMSKETWQTVDLIGGIIFLVSTFGKTQKY